MKHITSILLGLLMMTAVSNSLNGQTRKKNTRTKTAKVTRVSRNNVSYKKSRKKVVAVRNLPSNRRVIRHQGQTYQYANNRFYRYNGGRYIPVKPIVGLRIRILPVGYRTIVYNNRNFYEYDGIYYSRNSEEYEVIEPEVGTVIYELPNSYERVVIDGQQLYESNNVLYEKIQIDGTRAYEVVGIIGE